MSATIRYAIEGKGDPITLIHGVGANLESWDEVTQHLKSKFTVLRMDLRGHGLSKPITQNCELENFVEDVLEVINKAGFQKTDLIGFSMGGMVAQLFAITHPEHVNRLALISAIANRTPKEKRRLAKRAKIIREEGVGSVLGASEERWFTEKFRKTYPGKVKKRLDEWLKNDPASYAEAYRIFALSDVGERIKVIPHQTLIMTGENDIGSNPRMANFMHKKIQNSKLIILPRLRHSLLVEAPLIVATHLKDFLNKNSKTSS